MSYNPNLIDLVFAYFFWFYKVFEDLTAFKAYLFEKEKILNIFEFLNKKYYILILLI